MKVSVRLFPGNRQLVCLDEPLDGCRWVVRRDGGCFCILLRVAGCLYEFVRSGAARLGVLLTGQLVLE